MFVLPKTLAFIKCFSSFIGIVEISVTISFRIHWLICLGSLLPSPHCEISSPSYLFQMLIWTDLRLLSQSFFFLMFSHIWLLFPLLVCTFFFLVGQANLKFCFHLLNSIPTLFNDIFIQKLDKLKVVIVYFVIQWEIYNDTYHVLSFHFLLKYILHDEVWKRSSLF